MNKIAVFIVGVLLGILAGGVGGIIWESSVSSKLASDAELVQLISSASGGKAKFEARLPKAHGTAGLIGVLCHNISNGKKFVAWVPRSSDVVILGNVFTEKGIDLTYLQNLDLRSRAGGPEQVTEQNIQKEKAEQPKQPDSKQLSELVPQLEAAAGVKSPDFGQGHGKLYILFETTCGACRLLRKGIAQQDIQEHLADAQVSIKWLPAQLFNSAAREQGAKILAVQSLEPGDASVSEAKLELAREQVDRNSWIAAQALPNPALPLFFWKDQTGQPHIHVGIPKSKEAFFEIIDSVRRPA